MLNEQKVLNEQQNTNCTKKYQIKWSLIDRGVIKLTNSMVKLDLW